MSCVQGPVGWKPPAMMPILKGPRDYRTALTICLVVVRIATPGAALNPEP